MRRFNLDENINLHLLYTEDNEPVQSASVKVSVYDADNLSTVFLSSQVCAEQEVPQGYYVYDWAHSLTERTKLSVIYEDTDRERVFFEDVIVDKNIINEIDWQDADADGRVL